MTYYRFTGKNRYVMEAKEGAVKRLAESTGKNGFDLRDFIDAIQRAGAALHTRYENECNGFPFDKDGSYAAKYEAATERRERSLIEKAKEQGFTECASFETDTKRLGLFVALQRDPRGWPVILVIEGREYRLGGKY